MIEISNIHKSFGAKHVLNGISSVFEKGRANLIIGRSGMGKTVLLKSIIGLYAVDSGSIMYDERDITLMKQKEIRNLRQEVGLLFQGSALFDSLSVIKNVKFPLDMFTDMSEQEKIERANWCLKRVNIVNSNHLLPSEISGGMQKRVAIARAIALNPKYLFCDEPNSGLDPATSIVIDELIKEITEEFDTTTIINTHDMNSVLTIGGTVSFVHNGQIRWQGDSETLYDADDELLLDFVFASEIMKQVKIAKRHPHK
ncbi:MAG: hypothetical protein RIS47_840 [Bacteroidota bacterium]|jgi:phospholipid/cholesterol/gamma-HCH transport system ATP-binding protein